MVVGAVLIEGWDTFRVLVLRYQDTLHRHSAPMTGKEGSAVDAVCATGIESGALTRAHANLRRCRQTGRFGSRVSRFLMCRCQH